MSDKEALQGLWKIETMISRGNTVGHSDTHWEFDGDRVLEIIPTYVDGGTWAAFKLDETATPKRMEQTYILPNRDGGTREQTHKQCYELSGDTLRVGGAVVYGEYPPEINDEISTVTTLSRFRGERPEVLKASGTKPIESVTLGTVTWNDNLSQWDAQVKFATEQKVSVSITPGDDSDKNDIAPGEAFVGWAQEHDADARAYAAKQMVELAEDWQDQEDEDEKTEPITAESFAKRIRLSEISVEGDGSGTLWYEDDDIFAGHVIAVYVTADRAFTDAVMMG